MSLNLAFLPAAVAAAIQDGVLERAFQASLKPLLKWRMMADRERHMGRIGERVIKTRPGLLQPETEAALTISPGNDPTLATRSLEQFQYQLKSLGKSLPSDLPSSFLAAANLVVDDIEKLGQHCAQSMGRIARARISKAYGSSNTWATAAQGGGGSVTVPVADTNGFETVLVNGVFVAVSAQNPLAIHIGATAKLVTGFDAAAKTLTISVAGTWSQFDAVTADDCPKVFRQANRATDHLLVGGDTATIATFRNAKAYLVKQNVPGINGRVENDIHVCFVSPDVMNALFADAEFHDAIKAIGLTGPFADGAVGDYAGIRFVLNSEFAQIAAAGDIQTNLHESVMLGQGFIIEAYQPEEEFEREIPIGGIARLNHFKQSMDPEGVTTMVIRAPMDALGRRIVSSWVSNVDWTVPTDALSLNGPARFKRAALIHTAGPA